MSNTSTKYARRAPTRERRLPLGAPVRAWALAEWSLLPLRLFLGVTFTFAGFQKLANPNFFNAQSPVSVQAQLVASARISPIHALLSHLVQFATPLGILIAFSELAIGVGALLGLWTRIAAIGGALLSFSLFLTVSFHASPYYIGADIVFFFAWLPLILAGGGSRLSFDAWLANRAAREMGAPEPELVAIPFAKVQTICGHYNRNKCNLRHGLACEAAVCPVLLGDRAPIATRVAIDSIDRRTVVLGTATAVAVGAATLIMGGVAAEGGRLVGGAKPPTKTTGQLPGSGGATVPGAPTTTVPAGTGTQSPNSSLGALLGAAKDVPVGQAATFTIPKTQDPGIVLHPSSATFLAYDAVCPHAGCTVGYYAANNVMVCPCHGSQFDVTTGAVLNGPAPRGLTKLAIAEGTDGNLYLK